jgi:RNA polymerase sigma-70 factor (ECF subfamily)
MGYLRHARSAPSSAAPDDTCVAAFDHELDYIFATLRRLGARPSEVEDLAQEVFVVLHQKWTTIDTTRPLRPYLFGVAFRLFAAHRRRQRREIPFEKVEPEDDSPNPQSAFEGQEAAALLLAALEQVPLRRRAVIVMHELDEVPILEVARRLSMSQFGTYARLRKGRTELKAALRRLGLKDRSK